MTWFLLKGLLRDRHRSLFPILVIVGGVAITVLVHCWIVGVRDDVTIASAKLDTGHVKIMTRGYHEIAHQVPNDLAVTDAAALLQELKRRFPSMDWSPRIKFGGLLDFPDEAGETRAQGPVFGMALDLISPASKEVERLDLGKSIVRGRLPQGPGEILVSDRFALNLGVDPGDMGTLISVTANGSMAIQNFIVAGTVKFGVTALDRNAMLADVADIQYALDMEDSAGEILGVFPDLIYRERQVDKIVEAFNALNLGSQEDAPVMVTLREQNSLGEMLDLVTAELFIIITGLVFIMSVVLWNAGLMSGLRRYGEIGVRLAIGESKAQAIVL